LFYNLIYSFFFNTSKNFSKVKSRLLQPSLTSCIPGFPEIPCRYLQNRTEMITIVPVMFLEPVLWKISLPIASVSYRIGTNPMID